MSSFSRTLLLVACTIVPLQCHRPCCKSISEIVFTREADASGDPAIKAVGVSMTEDNNLKILAAFESHDGIQRDEPMFGYFVSGDDGETFRFESAIGPTKPRAMYDFPHNPYTPHIRYRVVHEKKTAQDMPFLERSSDGGTSWRRMRGVIGDTGQPMQGYAEPRFVSDRILVSGTLSVLGVGFAGIFASNNGGDSFQVLYLRRGGMPPEYDVSPVNQDVIYVEDGKGSILRTIDGGYRWDLVGENDEIRKPPVPEAFKGTEREKEILSKRWNYCHEIVLDRKRANIAYLVTDKGIIQTTDGGNHWCVLNLRFDKPASITSLVLSSKSAGTMFAGTTMGLYRTKDHGCSWDMIDIAERTKRK